MKDESLAAAIDRMVDVGQRYLADAALLQTNPHAASEGAYLLRLTAFEILLKALLRSSGTVPGRHHRYEDHFAALPKEVCARLTEGAAARMGPIAAYGELPLLLRTWTYNFVALRYEYESYEGKTADEVHAIGKAWLAEGAELADATFRHYPLELDGLLCALHTELGRPDDRVGG